MVGCAPSFYNSGILTSSINMAIVSLGLAPNRVFPFLFNFDYMANCVSFGRVFAEKLRKIVLTLFSLFENKNGTINEVFPTPESPVNKIGFLTSRSKSNIYLYFNVSIVGTIIS